MRAELLKRIRKEFDDGTVLEMVAWRVPEPVLGSRHPYKYRLFYGRAGKRIVERPKGDHRHIDGREMPYAFSTVERLVDDFLADVAARRNR